MTLYYLFYSESHFHSGIVTCKIYEHIKEGGNVQCSQRSLLGFEINHFFSNTILCFNFFFSKNTLIYHNILLLRAWSIKVEKLLLHLGKSFQFRLEPWHVFWKHSSVKLQILYIKIHIQKIPIQYAGMVASLYWHDTSKC